MKRHRQPRLVQLRAHGRGPHTEPFFSHVAKIDNILRSPQAKN